jgi:TrkA-C domain
MTFELFSRIHKELSITVNAVHEVVLAISERVNRKVEIIRLHWQASSLLGRIDEQTSAVGRQIVTHVSRRFLIHGESHPDLADLNADLSRATSRVHEFKRSLLQLDAQIRELKLEAIHEELLRLHHELKLRSARIDRLTIARRAGAVGQLIAAMPQPSLVHVAAILRGPFVLAPSESVTFRPDDIVILIGPEADLDHLALWFTGHRSLPSPTAKSA